MCSTTRPTDVIRVKHNIKAIKLGLPYLLITLSAAILPPNPPIAPITTTISPMFVKEIRVCKRNRILLVET